MHFLLRHLSNAPRAPATERAPTMKRFKNILAIVAFDQSNDTVLEKAIWLAKANDARLTLLDAVAEEAGALARMFGAAPDAGGAPLDAAALESEKAVAVVETAFTSATNMTESLSTLRVLCTLGGVAKRTAISAFEQKWRNNPLVM
ncbi:MAG: aminopeptidase N C-terminal domain-containing protein, partial [Pseudomonadota bacterium]